MVEVVVEVVEVVVELNVHLAPSVVDFAGCAGRVMEVSIGGGGVGD